MLPVIALVGRPNVGKSTLFNRLTKTRDALVADYAGLTRDRKYGDGKLGEVPYIVVDTGGISGMEEGIDYEMAEQSFAAIDEADIVLFLVDAQAGMIASDQMIAEYLRKEGKTTYLVVNKTDGLDIDIAIADFHGLGLAIDPMPIAASQNRGITKLMTLVLEPYLEEFADYEEQQQNHKGIKIAVVGRPNVGKSTLVNRMLGEERVVVYDEAGTTRDSIYIPFEREDKEYTLIDTAGVRRRKNIDEAIEKFSIIKALQAIQDSNVAILVVDAHVGLVEQDLHMLGFILNAGRALVVAINKWDGMEVYDKDRIKTELDRRLPYLDWADQHFISAKHGTNVGNMYKSIHTAYDSSTAKWSTNFLTGVLQGAIESHHPPLVRGRRIKLRMAHQGGSNPPVVVIHGNQTKEVPGSYKRYLENTFRKVLGIRGTPIQFEFKTTINPFADKKEKLHTGRYTKQKVDYSLEAKPKKGDGKMSRSLPKIRH